MDKRPRPKITYGITEKVMTGCGALYVTVNKDKDGKLVEAFASLGKSGGCAMAQNEAVMRLVSLCIRCDIPTSEIVDQLRNIRCPSPSIDDGVEILSCPDAVIKVLEKQNGGK
jgi:ribonucleoside-diphosphate reductase alpha chain